VDTTPVAGLWRVPALRQNPRLHRGNTYLWHVWVVIYEMCMGDCIHCIHQVIEAAAPRWMFEGGIHYVTKKMTKWSTRNIDTFRVEPVKELRLW
jgi:hypothetical protein